MGIQDRDYNWKKQQDAAKINNQTMLENPRHQSSEYPAKARKDSGLRFLIYPTLVIAALWFGADKFLQHQATRNAPASIQYETIDFPAIALPQSANNAYLELSAASDNAEPESKGAILKADAKGHFRGMVKINDVSMPFLIDTGATDTVVPAKLAIAAKLPFGRYVQSNTAGGRISVRETMIKDLRLGNAEVHNLKAQMNDHLNEVLIGMSTLRYFKMMQSGGTMTLIANKQSTGGAKPQIFTVDNRSPVNAEQQPSTGIKKTVTCDKNQVCTTKYSDH
jgi:aspartyl protease family protein